MSPGVAPRLARGPARRAALLLELRGAGVGVEGVGVEELAAAVGLHPNTAREHLEVLVAEGLVERHPGPRIGRGRPRTLYAAARTAPPAASAMASLSPATVEAHDLRDRVLRIVLSHYGTGPEDAAAAVEREGARWGEALGRAAGPVAGAAAVVELVARELDAMGMEPRALDAGGRVGIAACPLAELAHDHPDVVCGVHAAMLRGLARGAGAGDVDVRLLPFEGPLMCRVEVGAG